MESVLRAAARQFVSEQHLRNVLQGAWVPLYDADGQPLPGICGRIGACATKVDGTDIGIDLMKMSPGSAFPIHEHDGDHILYVMSGEGIIFINGQDHEVKQGDTIFIPAEYPHGVRTEISAPEPLVLLAFGHPHKHLEAKDRMKHPDPQ